MSYDINGRIRKAKSKEEKKAEKLLKQYLSPAQRRQYEEDHFFKYTDTKRNEWKFFRREHFPIKCNSERICIDGDPDAPVEDLLLQCYLEVKAGRGEKLREVKIFELGLVNLIKYYYPEYREFSFFRVESGLNYATIAISNQNYIYEDDVCSLPPPLKYIQIELTYFKPHRECRLCFGVNEEHRILAYDDTYSTYEMVNRECIIRKAPHLSRESLS